MHPRPFNAHSPGAGGSGLVQYVFRSAARNPPIESSRRGSCAAPLSEKRSSFGDTTLARESRCIEMTAQCQEKAKSMAAAQRRCLLAVFRSSRSLFLAVICRRRLSKKRGFLRPRLASWLYFCGIYRNYVAVSPKGEGGRGGRCPARSNVPSSSCNGGRRFFVTYFGGS